MKYKKYWIIQAQFILRVVDLYYIFSLQRGDLANRARN